MDAIHMCKESTMTIRYHVTALDKTTVILTATEMMEGFRASEKGDAGTGYATPATCERIMTIADAQAYMIAAKTAGATIERGENRS
jgi:hypothetical protein